MRDDPRFMQLARDAGLVDYWNGSGHWPDFCVKSARLDCKTAAARVQ
jgi:hypothetical protein